MSAYYSKFLLNTYDATPYFQAQMPPDYPLPLVLQKCRAFRRLPPNLRRLSRLARRWALRTDPNRWKEAEEQGWYDSQGNELDPDTGQRLTDAEIDAQWGHNDFGPDPILDALTVTDIPVPEGGFADPDTWEEPEPEEQGSWAWGRHWPDGVDVPTRIQLLWDVYTKGAAATAAYYGIPEDQLPVEMEDE